MVVGSGMRLSKRAKVVLGIAGAAALTGIVIAARKPKKSHKGSPGKGTTNGGSGSGCPSGTRPSGVDASGKTICLAVVDVTPIDQSAGDVAVMDSFPGGNAGYTSFFTQSSEQILSADLTAWKNAHPGRDCEPVIKTESDGVGTYQTLDYYPAARQATVDVLTQRYPTGGSGEAINWASALGSNQQWISWLFMRVENIAQRVVCDYVIS